MSKPTEQQGGWRSTPGGQPVRRRWHPDSPGIAGRLSVKSKRALLGSLTLTCAALIGWLIWLGIMDQVPAAQVVAFGISNYQKSAIFPPNRFGEEDAHAFQSLSVFNPRQFPKNDNIFIPDRSAGDEILKLVSGDRAGKNLIVFCSLHGRLTPSPLTAELYGINADGDFVNPEMVSIPGLIEQLKQTRAKHILLLVEAGHLQPHWPLGVLANECVAQIQQHVADAGLPNLCVICSARPYEVSRTSADARVSQADPDFNETATTAPSASATDMPQNQSVFAYYILEGLKGKADGWGPSKPEDKSDEPYNARHERNDRIDSDELHAYTAQQVANWVSHHVGMEERQTVTRYVSSHFKKFDMVVVRRQRPSRKSESAASANPKDAGVKTVEKKTATKKNVTASTKTSSPPVVAKLTDGPRPDQVKLFEAILFATADDPKKMTEVKAALNSSAARVTLAKWLIDQARKSPSDPMLPFNARSLLAEVANLDQADKPLELDLLKSLWELENPSSETKQLSERSRNLLLARPQAAALMARLNTLAPNLLAEVRHALRALIAAERWRLASVTEIETQQQADKAYQAFVAALQRIRDADVDLAGAIKLDDEMRDRLWDGQLAHHAADRLERLSKQPNWEDLKIVGNWMEQHAGDPATDLNQSPPKTEVLDKLSDSESQELLKFLRAATRLELLLKRPQQAGELKPLLLSVQNDWNKLSSQNLPISGVVNPRVAGVWHGFWAIETLRHRGLKREKLSDLWKQWTRMIHAASNDTGTDSELELAMRLSRVELGVLVQKAWAETANGRSMPSVPKSDGTDQFQDIVSLWKQIRNPDNAVAPRLRFSQSGNPEDNVDDDPLRREGYVVATQVDQKSAPGTAKVKIRVEDLPVKVPLKIRMIGSDLLTFSALNKTAREFDIKPNRPSLEVNVALGKSLYPQTAIVVLTESGDESPGWDFPVEIRRIQVNPPFDPSKWSVEFRTEKGKPLDYNGNSLWLPPVDEVTVVPYLIGPRLPNIKSVMVNAAPNRENAKSIAEFKPVVMDQPADGSQGAWKLELAAPAKAAAPVAAPTATAPVADAEQFDVSTGVKFDIMPQGLPRVTHDIPFTFYSGSAYIEDPIPVFKDHRLQIPILRDRNYAGHQLIWEKAVSVGLHLSSELEKLKRTNTTNVILMPGVESGDLSVQFVDDQEALLAGSRRFSLSVAGLPHAFHWEISANPPHKVDAKNPEVRIASPLPASAYLRESGKLHLWREGMNGMKKPTQVKLRIEVDSNEIRDSGRSNPWTLTYALSEADSASPAKPISRPLISTREESVRLAIKESGWKLTTSVNDFEIALPTDGLTGRFRIEAALIRDDGTEADRDKVDLVIDETKPFEPKFGSLPATHPAQSDFKFKVEVEDPESGIYEVVAGLDMEPANGMLDEGERLNPVNNPGSRVEFVIPKNQLPANGGRFRIIAQVLNGTRLQTTTGKSDFIIFLPPEMPKEVTTGRLRVTIDHAGEKAKWSLVGPTSDERTLTAGPATQEFADLEPGEYQLSVVSYNYQGTWKGLVVAKKPTVASIKMQSR